MPWSTELLNRWLTAWKGWPKWAQVASAAGLVCILGLAMLLGTSTSAETGRGDSLWTDPTGLMLDVFWKLSVIVVLIFVLAMVLRRWQAGGWKAAKRQMNVVETVHLGPRRALHLVRVGDRELLIGATDQSLTLLSEVEPPVGAPEQVQEQPSTAIPVSSFSDVLSLAAQPMDRPVRS